MTARTLRKVLALHTDPSVCLGTVATALAAADWPDPNAVKVLVDKRGDSALFFPLPFALFSRRGAESAAAQQIFVKHLGVYSYRPDTLRSFVRWPAGFFETAEKLEQLRALENGVRLRVAVTPDDSIGVDLPGDVARVEKILKRRGTGVSPSGDAKGGTMAKFIFVTGGVVSSLGKGIAASSWADC
jgi:3-deoxy-manno-octulosonate cytidylyltransferase (CMP-KDO synthetase)